MTIIASGRSALILATGLFVCFVAPLQAAISSDRAIAGSKPESGVATPVALSKSIKHGAHRWKRLAHHRSSKTALKSPTGDQPAATDDGDAASAIPSSGIPPSVANANAQLTAADTPTGSAKAISGAISGRPNDVAQSASDNTDNTRPANTTPVVSADQLNDVDRALHESEPPAATATTDPAAAPVAATGNEASSWDQASLIGKIFIGFGALLTMASAARMFMA